MFIGALQGSGAPEGACVVNSALTLPAVGIHNTALVLSTFWILKTTYLYFLIRSDHFASTPMPRLHIEISKL